MEYGAEEGCDLDDRAQWAAANPGRVEVSAIEAECRELSPGGFSRERLNIWPTDRAERVIDPDVWASLVSAGPVTGTKPSAIGVDATPAPRREFAVAAAWLSDGGVHVELDCSDRVDPLDALAHVVERAGRRIPVVIASDSPAGALIAPMKAQRCKVAVVSSPEMARAVGGFVDDAHTARLSHDGHPQLAAAVAAARKRPVGLAGSFGWDYRAEGSVLLVSTTLARFGAVTARRSGHATFV